LQCIASTTLYTETRPRQPYTSADQAQLRNETKERDRAKPDICDRTGGRAAGRGGARRGAPVEIL